LDVNQLSFPSNYFRGANIVLIVKTKKRYTKNI